MTIPPRIPIPDSFGITPENLVVQLLAEQQSLTAVERFSNLHAAGTTGDAGFENKAFYRDLIPLREPAPGEQYAFEVDLDRCTGCKACVTACHSLNGLDEDETWRTVGALQSAPRVQPAVADALASISVATLKPAQQHVTTACHHCAEPGCVEGCPTLAYEKDPITGVVRHLDDQCFGCQYCVLKCPYDVPQYSAKRGIVRKCDLCIGRLRAGEAPACAQACPTQAIRVTLVETAVVRAAPAAAFDLPDVPDPSRVMPTTRYVSKRGLPKNLSATDSSQVRPEHAHTPLVLMLVASQAAAGYWALLTTAYLIRALSGNAPDLNTASDVAAFPWAEVFGVLGVQAALALSLFHLGRPWLAWKAVLGWRRSWLSREVIAFTALAGTTGLSAALALTQWFAQGYDRFALSTVLPSVLRADLRIGLACAVLFSAWAAVYASAMVYRDTPRLLWATRATLWRFGLTALICGIPAWLLIQQALPSLGGLSERAIPYTLALLPFAQLFKLLLESAVLRHREDDDPNALWKAAQLLWGPYRRLRAARGALGLVGGILLPCLCLAGLIPIHGADGLVGAIALTVTLLLVTAGELIERYFFFTTAVAPRMPGARV